MKTETKLLESNELKKVISEQKEPKFCQPYEVAFYNALINNRRIKKMYQDGITYILKSVFGQFWVESTEKEMSGFYGVESPEGRSILNNLNTNFNAFCLLVKAVNRQIENIGKPEKKFDFSKESNRTFEEVKRFLNALNHFKDKIFTKENEDFINIINVLLVLWKRGQKSENNAEIKLKEYFGKEVKISHIGGHGVKKDAFKGVDISIHMDGKTYTAQIKPYSTTKIDNDVISLLDTGNVKKYDVDWMIFSHPKTNRILIFKNDPISTQDMYSFNLSSLIHEIE